AEDGIRDRNVTGVQTCALPISVAVPQYPDTIDNYYVGRVTVEKGFNHVKTQLDEASERGVAWVVFVSHIYTDWYSDEYVRQIIRSEERRVGKESSSRW